MMRFQLWLIAILLLEGGTLPHVANRSSKLWALQTTTVAVVVVVAIVVADDWFVSEFWWGDAARLAFFGTLGKENKRRNRLPPFLWEDGC